MTQLYLVNKFFSKLAYLKQINPYQKAVMEALLSFFGRDGQCYPSIALIAQTAGVCETTVKKTLREFRLRGWIDWTNTRKGRRQSSNHYQIKLTHKKIITLLNAVRDIKRVSKNVRQFFSENNIPHTPYYCVRYLTEKMFRQKIERQIYDNSCKELRRRRYHDFYGHVDKIKNNELRQFLQRNFVY